VKHYDVHHVPEHNHELSHLEGGEVLLPPEELLVLGTQRSHGVVRVHDHVHERVDQCVEGSQSPSGELDSPPPSESHQGVMKHVQEGNVLVFLPCYEEVRVQELNVLGQPEVEADVQHPQRLGRVGVIALLTHQGVPGPPTRHQKLIEKVRREHHHHQVVPENELPDVERLPVPHEPLAGKKHNEEVGEGGDGVELP